MSSRSFEAGRSRQEEEEDLRLAYDVTYHTHITPPGLHLIFDPILNF